MTININLKAIIALLVVLILLVAAWFGSDYFKYSKYQLIIQNPVSGLAMGAPVEYNGVVVGQVAEVSFNPHDPQKLSVVLSVKKGTPITQGTEASFDLSEVITQKFTGFPYVFISLRDNGKNLQPLIAKIGQVYPVIPMASLTTENGEQSPALVQMSQTMAKTHALFETLLAEENVESLTQLMYSLQQVSNVLAANSEKLDTILGNAEQASHQFKPLLTSGKSTMQSLKTQTLPEMHHLMNNLNNTLALMRELVIKISNNPTVLIRGEAMPELGPGEEH